MLQKRTLSHWSYVTWYEDLEQAKKNFLAVSKEGNGYSWRLVEVKVIEEKLLDGVKEAESGSDILTTHQFVSPKPTQPVKSDWGTPQPGAWDKPTSEAPIKPEHGLTGSVWVGNPTTKEKRRVVGFEANRMLTEGWIKVGPRTVL